MKQEELAALTDQQLLEEAKKMKSAAITNAFLIGFLIGILIFSAASNGFGLLMLIPLFLIYKFTTGNKEDAAHNAALKKILQERNLE